jgi:hypothetical protein
MHLIDLALSFILFALGALLIIRGKARENLWVVLLALVSFPIALYTYYFPETRIALFGSFTLLQLLMYPFMKVLILLSLIRYIQLTRRGS